jgi:hypothetical protein
VNAYYVVVLTPEPGREYGPIEVIGVFTSEDFAQDYIDHHIEVGEGWQAEAVPVQSPSDDFNPASRL